MFALIANFPIVLNLAQKELGMNRFRNDKAFVPRCCFTYFAEKYICFLRLYTTPFTILNSHSDTIDPNEI